MTAIAHESHAQRPGKHDFAEVAKAVVQLMAKDGRCCWCRGQLGVVLLRVSVSVPIANICFILVL